MKKHYFIILLMVFASMGMNTLLPAQDNTTVPQVIIGNGGRFETNPPYFDYVTVAYYNTATHTYTLFDTIYTQSVQDILVVDHYAYVAAQDTIVKYDLDTHQRLFAVADSGMVKLGIYNDKLIVTKGFPVTRFFAEVLSATDLSLFSFIDGITGDCGGVVASLDSVYIAVNGGYQGTEGQIAIVNTSSWTVTHQVDFGPDAIGIFDLFGFGGNIYTINVTPGGSSNIGSITKFNQFTETYSTNVLNVLVGNGVGVEGTLMYVEFNNGIGSYDLTTDAIADTLIVRDPGAPNHIYFLAAALDYVNNDFYINIGNYSNPGKGFITTIAGDSLSSFNEGISPNAIAIEYSTPAGINNVKPGNENLVISPNPVSGSLKATFGDNSELRAISIMDITGRNMYSSELKGNEKSVRINASSFPAGVYFLTLSTNNGNTTKKFIKQ